MLHLLYVPLVFAAGAYAHAKFFPRLVVEFRDAEGLLKKDISAAEISLKSKVQSLKKKI